MEENKNNMIIDVLLEDIIPNRFQPRLAFDETELNKLADSIKKYGVIQPVVLRKIGDKYEIIAGERRYKASVLAGKSTIPAIIKNTDDNTSSEIALLENLQRKNLTVIEEAQSYKKLIDKNYTQDEIANKLGVSQSSIANKLRLLTLPKEVQDALLYNKISERHARSLLSLNDSELQIKLLNKIMLEKLTVRETEEEINKILNNTETDNDIPDDIKTILNTQQDNKFIDESFLKTLEEEHPVEKEENKIPEVVNISDVEEKEPINPFQVEFEDNLRKIEEKIRTEDESYYDKVINSNLNPESNLNTEPKLPEELETIKIDKPNLPNMISKVREFVSDLNKDNIITTEEVDLPDKYKIVIEIEK